MHPPHPFRDFRQGLLEIGILNRGLQTGQIALNGIDFQHNFPATTGNLVPQRAEQLDLRVRKLLPDLTPKAG